MAKKSRKPGAGAPKKPLNVRILEGNPGKRPLSRLEFAEDALGEATTEPPDFLPAQAAAIFEETSAWLEKTGCLPLIPPAYLEEYALCKARWRECERRVSEIGLLAKHPTSGKPVPSPFVDMAAGYLKQADAAWDKIDRIVKENCTKDFSANTENDAMENLLNLTRNEDRK